ncbi:hypothetical protein HZD82_22730, partial [Pantoea agglomerans]|nr:hypothetical protein [Pantoea agglomerans]
ERLKKQSNYLRGTIKEDLEEGLTGGFTGDNFLLIRFHGMYSSIQTSTFCAGDCTMR